MCPSGRTLASGMASGAAPELKSAFDLIDADRDGKISRDDLRRFYAGIWTDGSTNTSDFSNDHEMIGTMMSLADSDKDGFVEYEEFERVLGGNKGNSSSSSAASASPAGVIMVDVFKAMDKDGDGKLSRGDLKSYLQMAGFDASDDDVAAMIMLGSGGELKDSVSYEDLLRILDVDV